MVLKGVWDVRLPHGYQRSRQVRKLQRALYRTSKQDKKKRFYSLYDKVWRADVLWEAWRQVKANKGAPGVDGMAIETIINTGQEEEMITKLQKALREQRHQFAPVRVVEIPKPKGGTRPLGIATVEDRVVQTAMRLVVEPIFEADFHDCSYGYRPKRDAKQASIAIREDLYHRAWGVVEVDFKSYFTSIPHRKLMKLITQADRRRQSAEADQTDAEGRGARERAGGADEGRGTARLTDLALVQQHLPEPPGSTVA